MKKRKFKKLMNGTKNISTPFKVGQTITVVRHKIPYSNGHFDRSWIGDELKLLAIDYPFIKVEHTSTGLKGHVSVMSADAVEFKVLDKNFVNIKCKDK